MNNKRIAGTLIVKYRYSECDFDDEIVRHERKVNLEIVNTIKDKLDQFLKRSDIDADDINRISNEILHMIIPEKKKDNGWENKWPAINIKEEIRVYLSNNLEIW